MIDLPENELALRAKAGDEEAEDALIRRMDRSCRWYAFRNGRVDEDAAQEARLGVLQAVRGLPEKRVAHFRFRVWAKLFAKGKAGHLYAQEARRREVEAAFAAEPRLAANEDVERAAVRADLAEKVQALLATLSPDNRLIVNEGLLGGADYASIARRLGLTRQAVQQRAHRLKRNVLPELLASLRDAV